MASLAVLASLGSLAIKHVHHLTGGMAILVLLASLGSLRVMRLDTWVWYDVAYGQPCPGDAPGAVEQFVQNEWIGDRYYCAGKSLLTHFVMKHH